MKAYKGFDENMQCRGFQYEEGKTYETDKAELCETGFHACTSPLNVFAYYPPGKNSKYHVVEIENVTDEKSDDSKVCGTKITVGAELGIPGLVKAHVEWVKENVTKHVEKGDSEAVAVGDKESASAGEYGSASAGEYGSASAGRSGSASAGWSGSASAGRSGSASAGEYGSASAGWSGSASAGWSGSASAGEYGSASAGEYGSASAGRSGSASAGWSGSASAGRSGSASAGEYGSASAGWSGSASAGWSGSASAGEYGSASAGEYGSAVSRWKSSVEDNGVAVARGNGNRVKGGIGSVLVLVEENKSDCEIRHWKAEVVDGERIKADTWYQLDENGEFQEVKE